ncbi:MAG: hypothetical protein NTY65_04390 [Planctomycetota bacterium]|nr:hypothetical protein [Planctomycetota bacterium]
MMAAGAQGELLVASASAEESPQGTWLMWAMYLVVWLAAAAASLIAIRLGILWALPVVLMAPLTMAGILWRPLFGLCLMAALMPIGTGLGMSGLVSAERGVGLLVLLCSIPYIIRQRRLRLFNVITLTLFAYMLVALLSVTWALYPHVALPAALTPIQLFVYMALLLALCWDERELQWPLRAFAVSCMLTAVLPRLLGLAPTGAMRFTVAFGEDPGVNPNLLGAIFGLGFLTCFYLLRKDPHRVLRWVWIFGLVVLPVGVLMTASRKAAYFLVPATLIPLLSPRLLLRRPWLVIGIAAGLALVGVAVIVGASYVLPETTVNRLIDPTYRDKSALSRFELIKQAAQYAASHPLGAGMRCFRTSNGTVAHNAFFDNLACLGLMGGGIYVVLAISMVVVVLRMRSGIEKWYAGAILGYLLLLDLGGDWMATKHYWFFLAVVWLMRQYQVQAALADSTTAGELLPAALRPDPGRT